MKTVTVAITENKSSYTVDGVTVTPAGSCSYYSSVYGWYFPAGSGVAEITADSGLRIVEITCTVRYGSPTWNANVGQWADGKWTGESNSVSLTAVSYGYITGFTVTYKD